MGLLVVSLVLALLVWLLLVFADGGIGGVEVEVEVLPAAPKVAAPAPHVPRTDLEMSSARRGKAPDRPSPTLTQKMLQAAAAHIQAAKELNNEGVKLRNAGDNRGARAKQSEAKGKIDEAVQVLEAPAAWQEEADLEGWAMPAEYVTLSKLFGQIAKLEKRIRMSGGQ